MTDKLNGAIESYWQKWTALVESSKNQEFFKALKPTAACWKVEDSTEYEAWRSELKGLSTQIHEGWINERWLATYFLKDTSLPVGLQIVKVYEKRPGSTDLTGIDHLDFITPDNTDLKAVLELEPGLRWTEENNGDHCKWISIWYEGSEAKLRGETVLQVCADELLDCQRQVALSDIFDKNVSK